MNKPKPSPNIVDTILVPHTAFQKARERLNKVYRNSNRNVDPMCVALIGESRTGKSRVLEDLFRKYPAERNSEGLDVPILRVSTPAIPTIKGLAELMLRTMRDPRFDRGTMIGKTDRLRVLLGNSGTRVILIDEFQHFYDVGSHRVMHSTANWLKVLVDESQCALVVAGLPSCMAVIDQNEQLAGRFLSPIHMPRFVWRNNRDRADFVGILKAFGGAIGQQFSLPKLESEEMAFRFYCATGGLMGYLTKVLKIAVTNAIENKQRSISLADLEAAHEEAVWYKERVSDIASPFSKSFKLLETTELLDKIAQIGIPIQVAQKGRGRLKAAA